MIQLPSFAVLARLLTDHDQMSTLLPQLHEQAIRAVGGTSSMLLQVNPRTALMHPTSGHGIEQLPDEPWALAAPETRSAEEAFNTGEPVIVTDLPRRLPDLARMLKASSALFVPLVHFQEPIGVLVIGTQDAHVAPAVAERINWVGHAFVLALERARLRRDAQMQHEIRNLLDGFSRVASSALNLATGLEVFCREANRLFGADRTSVWLHDRRARDLVFGASSDPAHGERGTRVPADSVRSPAAMAMRRERAEIRGAEGEETPASLTSTITVPLRGRRRALGTLVFDGIRIEPGTELDVLDDADELGRQLSTAMENIQLLEEVLRSRRELESTFNSIPDLVAVCDTRLRVIQVNQAFSERLGVAREQASGRPLGECIGFEASGWIAKLDLWGSSGVTQTFTREVDDPVLNGRHAFTVSTLIGPDGEPLGAVVVARDVSRQAKLEAERAALRDRLTESEKLAVLGQFVAGIAHELNNPLQSVLGHVELLRRHAGVSKEIKQDLQLVYREADRAAKVVRDLLIFAGRRRHAGRAMNLNAVVLKVLRSRAAACRAAGIEVVRDLDESMPRLHGDPLRLGQAILNVFTNAEQALQKEGQIEVRTRYWPSRSVAVLEIRDSGPGIPPDVLPHIFEPFFTTKEVGRGTGLGLTITYGVVQDHAGQVLAVNHQSGGAMFTIELPVRAGTAPAETAE
jgi:signal transduction histidine kinase/GAF domain-containing protein